MNIKPKVFSETITIRVTPRQKQLLSDFARRKNTDIGTILRKLVDDLLCKHES